MSSTKAAFMEDFKHYCEIVDTPQFKEVLYADYISGKQSFDMELYLALKTGQAYGPLMEGFCIKSRNAKKVPSKEDRGDFKIGEEKYYEHKFSYAKKSKNFKFNFVQIRPWQNLLCEVFEVYQEGVGLFSFEVPHSDVLGLLDKYGNLAHGTIESNKNEKKEYALRGNIGGPLWNDLQKYKI